MPSKTKATGAVVVVISNPGGSAGSEHRLFSGGVVSKTFVDDGPLWVERYLMCRCTTLNREEWVFDPMFGPWKK